MRKDSFITGNFYCCGKPLKDAPVWGMSIRSAGSMRFRWNETNPLRDNFLSGLAGDRYDIVPVELIHSKTVYSVSSSKDTFNLKGDGIITVNKRLIPVVTAADCMPIFIFDRKTGVYGALHSGWKGTGIVETAIMQARRDYGSDPADFYVVMAPHIHECCYDVDKNRAEYFIKEFSTDCVTDKGNGIYGLSLANANLAVLKKIGIKEENIYISPDCTCCNEKFGSFRRESVAVSGGLENFTVQAAWIKW